MEWKGVHNIYYILIFLNFDLDHFYNYGHICSHLSVVDIMRTLNIAINKAETTFLVFLVSLIILINIRKQIYNYTILRIIPGVSLKDLQ